MYHRKNQGFYADFFVSYPQKSAFLILKIDLLGMFSGNTVIYVIDYNFIPKKKHEISSNKSKLQINAIKLLISSSNVANF